MAGNWVKLTGTQIKGGNAPRYAINMDCVTDVSFGNFTSGKAMLHLTSEDKTGGTRSIFLTEDDAAIVKEWLDTNTSTVS